MSEEGGFVMLIRSQGFMDLIDLMAGWLDGWMVGWLDWTTKSDDS